MKQRERVESHLVNSDNQRDLPRCNLAEPLLGLSLPRSEKQVFDGPDLFADACAGCSVAESDMECADFLDDGAVGED
jgi:hypothetical protein